MNKRDVYKKLIDLGHKKNEAVVITNLLDEKDADVMYNFINEENDSEFEDILQFVSNL